MALSTYFFVFCFISIFFCFEVFFFLVEKKIDLELEETNPLRWWFFSAAFSYLFGFVQIYSIFDNNFFFWICPYCHSFRENFETLPIDWIKFLKNKSGGKPKRSKTFWHGRLFLTELLFNILDSIDWQSFKVTDLLKKRVATANKN